MKRLIVFLSILIVLSNANKAFCQLPGNLDAGAVGQDAVKPNLIAPNQETNQTNKKDQENIQTNEVENNQQSNSSVSQNSDDKTTIQVKSFQVNPSEIISTDELNAIVKPYINKEVSIDDLNQVIKEINNVYVQKGYITARAFLPPQTVSEGTVQIKLIEGHIGQIFIDGNKYTKKSYIEGRISQKVGDLVKLKELEKDILKFNRNNSVALRANLKPGKEVGTTDIYLSADDHFPYHISATFDNTGRNSVGVLKGGIAFSSDSLFGYRDQFTAGYQRAKSTNVAYSSYFLPVGSKGTKIGGSFGFSQIRVTEGPFKVLNISGTSFSYAGTVSQEFISTKRFDFSGDISVNFKQVKTFIDNNRIFSPTQVRSLTTGINLSLMDKYGRWISRHEVSNGLDLLGGTAQFIKYDASVTRITFFPHNIVWLSRAALQLSPDRLPPVEQFQIGGSGTVRGYTEGLNIGDSGYFVSNELRVPIPFLPKMIGKLKVRDNVRALAFIDNGGTFFAGSGHPVARHTNYLTSLGLGLRVSLTKYLDGRLDYGFGIGQRETPQPAARLHFGLEAKPF